jgi:hypothetical protein
MNESRCQVAVYYFPNWHPCAWTEPRYGPGQSEWVAVQNAVPRFPGHKQPKVPLWGYEDESDPAVMEKKIAAAADHGVDAFLFDWYWWENGPSLEAALEKGYFGAANRDRVQFAIMWANHRPVSRQTFDQAVDHIVNDYFPLPSYWKVEGRPYFSIYELHTLIAGLETGGAGSTGVDETLRAIDSLREKTLKAGFPGLHFNGVEWGLRNLPDASFEAQNWMIDHLGIDSVTDYVWVHHAETPGFPENDYLEVAGKAYADWDRFSSGYRVPYHPNVTMGWDSWPRVPVEKPFEPGAYPATPLITANPPAAFRTALEQARRWLERPEISQKILTVNAWNEWTEGSYLEPDTEYGLGYLEAIRDVFGNE